MARKYKQYSLQGAWCYSSAGSQKLANGVKVGFKGGALKTKEQKQPDSDRLNWGDA